METDERPSKMQKQVHDTENEIPVEFEKPNSPSENNGTEPANEYQSDSVPNRPAPNPLSKKQQKKQRRQQEWEAGRADRALKRREKAKEKKQRIREEREVARANGQPEPPRRRARNEDRSVQLPITIVIDCSFDDLMLDNEMKSLASQICRCYSDNKRSPYKAHLAVSSFSGNLKARFENVLSNQHLQWKNFHASSEDYVATAKQAVEWMSDEDRNHLEGPLSTSSNALSNHVIDESSNSKPDVVYLSSESENVLTSLTPNTTYVIGGLVDKNRYKGLCHRRASERGIRTAKLPIGDYLQMASRQVLTTNHVAEIILRWLEVGDWGEAFMRVIPKRKGGTLKSADTNGEDGGLGESDHVADGGGDGQDAAYGKEAEDDARTQTTDSDEVEDVIIETG